MKSNERYELGLSKLAEIGGEQGQKVIESRADISPDFAHYLIELSLAAFISISSVNGNERVCYAPTE